MSVENNLFSACDDDPQPVGEAPLMYFSAGPAFVQPIRSGTVSLLHVTVRLSFPEDPSGGERYPCFPDEDGEKSGERAILQTWLQCRAGGTK